MNKRMAEFAKATSEDAAVDGVVAFVQGGMTNTGMMFIMLKPLAERKLSGDQVIARLRANCRVSGCNPVPSGPARPADRRRMGNAQYQYTLYGDDLKELTDWAPRFATKLKSVPASPT